MRAASYLRWRIRRKIPRLTRVGWALASIGVRSSDTGRTVAGLGLMAAGALLRRSRTRELVYAFELDPGEAATIRVVEGRRGAVSKRVQG